MKRIVCALAPLLICANAVIAAQVWVPQKNVEIVGSAPGGSNDKTARTVERILLQGKLVDLGLAK